MAVPLRTGIVYRRGNPTAANFTPRPKDCVANPPAPASEPGLSTFMTPGDDSTQRHRAVDLALLPPELCGFADDPSVGGTEGHVTIAPVTPDGRVDVAGLRAWAATRGEQTIHPFTRAVMRAAGLRVADEG